MMTLCGGRGYSQGTEVHFKTVERDVIENRLKLANRRDDERATTLEGLFRESGCKEPQLTEQAVKHRGIPNVICIAPGTGSGDGLILVGAHMDHVHAGLGVVDDWSGAALLPSLFQSLHDSLRKHTFVFVGFTDEEDGLVGSKFYVKQLDKTKIAGIRAMVNLECLGLTPTKVWAHHADPKLLAAFVNIAGKMNQPVSFVNVEKVGDDDADSFRAQNVPTITIHSVTQETITILHSPRDDFPAIHAEEYYNSFYLTSAYLAYLDELLQP